MRVCLITVKLVKIKCLHPLPPIVDDSNTMMDSNNNIVESRTDTNQNMDIEMCLCICIAKAFYKLWTSTCTTDQISK